MCGLVGMAGGLSFKHRAVMKNLLFFNTLRGKDSTGVTAYDSGKNEIDTRKMTCPGYDFILQPWIDGLLHACDGVWLGHGRFKTVGDVSRLNAHPFSVLDENDLINLFGAHNGTLSNKHDIQKELGEEFGTDSEALLNLINKIGAKEAISKASGAWALTWWDSTDTVNLLRNRERTLYYTFTEDMKTLIWASESWMIRVACAREDLKLIVDSQTKNEVVYLLPEDTLFKFKLPSFTKDDECFGLPEREGGLLGLPEKAHFFGGGWRDEYDWKKIDKETEAKRKEADKNRATKDEVVGFEGKLISRGTVEALKSAGCDWCGGDITSNLYAWLDEYDIVCGKCLRGQHFKVDVKEGIIIDRVLKLVKE